jgi:YHS domain-containing protein
LYAGLMMVAIVAIAVLTVGIRSRVRRTGSGERSDAMVLDPVCSTYVPQSRAVVRRIDSANVYFCSEACAEQFVPLQQGDHGR